MDMLDYMFQQLQNLFGWILGGIAKLIGYLIGKMFSSWTGFITGVVVIGAIFLIYKCSDSSSAPKDRAETELYQGEHSLYVCTARKSLKVRIEPNVSAKQIGSLMRGEEVEVYEIVGDFAKVNFNGEVGYASTDYLKKK